MFRYGRTNRATYWLSLAVIAAIYAVLVLTVEKPPHVAEVVLIIVAVPRLHDIGRSGWWAGGVILAEIAVMIPAVVMLPPQTAYIVIGLFSLVLIGLLVLLGLIPGDPQANRFGDPPAPGISMKRRQDADVVKEFD